MSTLTDRARELAEAVYDVTTDCLAQSLTRADWLDRVGSLLAAALQRERDEALREAAERLCSECLIDIGITCEKRANKTFCKCHAAILADQPKDGQG